MNTAYPILHRLRRYLIVGTLSTLIDIGLFAGLTGGLRWPTLAANTLSYSAGIINGYTLNRRWTYGDGMTTFTHQTLGPQFVRFVLVSLAALMINTILVFLLTSLLERLTTSTYGVLLAKATAAGVSLGWNFLLNHFWTFRNRTIKAPQLARKPI